MRGYNEYDGCNSWVGYIHKGKRYEKYYPSTHIYLAERNFQWEFVKAFHIEVTNYAVGGRILYLDMPIYDF